MGSSPIEFTHSRTSRAYCRVLYSHTWQVGDVLVWDQRATMHRGTPWPYEQPRTLASVCCSMTDSDGLAEARGLTM
ncbi:TauD/TfdA family dioxygenase [Pseudophaeobacter sp. EL27]|uniref:TauD/TfdA family dioxygenase n=1 Tax=Pseudophaeobacter sp. EL27 TaxID=2107580 RepID=UPI0020B17007|nr:TauD/TfdA family dioxygenase [Pseudophaeobacter sp. EL27]